MNACGNIQNLWVSGLCSLPGILNKQKTQTKKKKKKKKKTMVLVRERNKPTERPPLLREVVANFCG
jgi:hypothetical protein